MSSSLSRSLIEISSLHNTEIELLFSVADQISAGKLFEPVAPGQTGALLFFEASTRTRMSFETACARWGVHALRLEGKTGSSLEKGETFEDTVLNVAAMNPSFLVIRSGEDLDLKGLQKKVSMPIINGGWGGKGHPTQALLDAYTLRQHFGKNLKGLKLLIVGDVRHSRVASSHIQLAEKLNYEIAFCGPEEFLPTIDSVRVFNSLSDGMKWCDAVMALRVQLERHAEKYSLSAYRKQFGLTDQSIQALGAHGVILHPGPVNQGTEMDTSVLGNSRCRVLQQVSNGVLIRQSLIYTTLQGGS